MWNLIENGAVIFVRRCDWLLIRITTPTELNIYVHLFPIIWWLAMWLSTTSLAQRTSIQSTKQFWRRETRCDIENSLGTCFPSSFFRQQMKSYEIDVRHHSARKLIFRTQTKRCTGNGTQTKIPFWKLFYFEFLCFHCLFSFI